MNIPGATRMLHFKIPRYRRVPMTQCVTLPGVQRNLVKYGLPESLSTPDWHHERLHYGYKLSIGYKLVNVFEL